jgi:hypothetical protein
MKHKVLSRRDEPMVVLEGADEPVLLWKQMISRGQVDLAPAHRAFCRAALKAHSQRLAAPACAENTAPSAQPKVGARGM